jgi:hypothetical protein
MQKIGDVCENCRERWEAKGKEPKVLQEAAHTTLKKKFKVPLCDYCDGGALGIINLGNHEGLEEV